VLRLCVDQTCLELDATSASGLVGERLIPRSEVAPIADADLAAHPERRAYEPPKRIGERQMPRVANWFGPRKRSDPHVEPDDRREPGQCRECQPGRLSALDAARL
jgi:hypothetical protein